MSMLIVCLVGWVMCVAVSYGAPHYAPAGETIAICLGLVGLLAGAITVFEEP
ncbi:MAG: hypothetical protein ABF876_12890 [Acetobacter aceti]|uniref:hypothetical protein n=1 Tax=Acetobacter aceti TaxID=435 RepID=UPI0016576206|nr:hypothetical protein [Acetobacter aceti]